MACFGTEQGDAGGVNPDYEKQAKDMFCGLCWKESKKQFTRRMKKAAEWEKQTKYDGGYDPESSFNCCYKCCGCVCCPPCFCGGLSSYLFCGLTAALLECTGDLSDEDYEWNPYRAVSKCGYACMWCPGHFLQTTFCCGCVDKDLPGHPGDPLGYGFEEQRMASGVGKFIYDEVLPPIPNPCDGELECDEVFDGCSECCCPEFPLCKVIKCCRGDAPRIGFCCFLTLL
jgi:hypothetical protein